jgi:hypothetical protein
LDLGENILRALSGVHQASFQPNRIALWPINNIGSISGNQWRTDKELKSELVRKLRFAKL